MPGPLGIGAYNTTNLQTPVVGAGAGPVGDTGNFVSDVNALVAAPFTTMGIPSASYSTNGMNYFPTGMTGYSNTNQQTQPAYIPPQNSTDVGSSDAQAFTYVNGYPATYPVLINNRYVSQPLQMIAGKIYAGNSELKGVKLADDGSTLIWENSGRPLLNNQYGPISLNQANYRITANGNKGLITLTDQNGKKVNYPPVIKDVDGKKQVYVAGKPLLLDAEGHPAEAGTPVFLDKDMKFTCQGQTYFAEDTTVDPNQTTFLAGGIPIVAPETYMKIRLASTGAEITNGGNNPMVVKMDAKSNTYTVIWKATGDRVIDVESGKQVTYNPTTKSLELGGQPYKIGDQDLAVDAPPPDKADESGGKGPVSLKTTSKAEMMSEIMAEFSKDKGKYFTSDNSATHGLFGWGWLFPSGQKATDQDRFIMAAINSGLIRGATPVDSPEKAQDTFKKLAPEQQDAILSIYQEAYQDEWNTQAQSKVYGLAFWQAQPKGDPPTMDAFSRVLTKYENTSY